MARADHPVHPTLGIGRTEGVERPERFARQIVIDGIPRGAIIPELALTFASGVPKKQIMLYDSFHGEMLFDEALSTLYSNPPNRTQRTDRKTFFIWVNEDGAGVIVDEEARLTNDIT